MMIRNSAIKIPTNPVLIDKALAEFQEMLSSVAWLDLIYGNSDLHRDTNTGKVIRTPVAYVGTNKGKEYEPLFPDSHKGNFSFFAIEDGVASDERNPESTKYTAKLNLIVWFDFRKLYPSDWKDRTVQHVISEVRDAIKQHTFRKCEVKINRHFVEPENIYKGFSDVELNSKSLMRPFCGFRLEGTITFSDLSLCSE